MLQIWRVEGPLSSVVPLSLSSLRYFLFMGCKRKDETSFTENLDIHEIPDPFYSTTTYHYYWTDRGLCSLGKFLYKSEGQSPSCQGPLSVVSCVLWCQLFSYTFYFWNCMIVKVSIGLFCKVWGFSDTVSNFVKTFFHSEILWWLDFFTK